jgi:hypothetical protein
MSTFVLVMALCGGVAAYRLTWIFVSLVGLFAVPVFCAVLVLRSGESLPTAILQASAGFIALQVSYVLAGVGIDLIGARLPKAIRPRKSNGGQKT